MLSRHVGDEWSTTELPQIILHLLVVLRVQPAFEDAIETGLVVLCGVGEVDVGEVEDMLGGVDVSGDGKADVVEIEVEVGDGTVVASLTLREEYDAREELKGLGGGLMDAGDDDELGRVSVC